ncbi:MAG TPA: glycine--tRNA ligase subunit beta [Usitatibacter sp.]|nr:glycine--tRNA ligase subunit beta [Usitatibacter sp.]
MSAPLLVELFCEELPPLALRRLGEAFAQGIADGLASRGLLEATSSVRPFASPRRLGALILDVKDKGADEPVEDKLMPRAVAFGADGRPTDALRKRLAKAGRAELADRADLASGPDRIEVRKEGNAEYAYLCRVALGQPLQRALQEALEAAIEALPIPKVMSYQLADGETTVRFVRPAHGLVALHGANGVDVSVLGLRAGRLVHGHRFQGAAGIELAHASEYEARLRSEGGVIAGFDERRDEIRRQLATAASATGASLGPEEARAALLDEVTALVEMPTVYAGGFEAEFLAVPPECLALTMRQNQKYFPLFDAHGRLANRFLMVSNMRLADPSNIVHGNERVVRPRLADARFFYETDRKTRLAERVPQLASIVYHHKLGTQLERVERLRRLAVQVQARLPRGDKGKPYADRAAFLAKADLVTLMVGEFPELQGVMGRYYAEADGEEKSVARAIEQHYWPRFAGDQLPTGDASVAVALADKLCTLAGLFGVGQHPTGDKDPFALRRNALGVVRILAEGGFDLSLAELIDEAFAVFPKGLLGDARGELEEFVVERVRGYLREKGYSANEVESVLSTNRTRLHELARQLQAVRAFAGLPESESLAAANKRVANILRQAAAKGESFANVGRAELREPAELALYDRLAEVSGSARPLFDRGDYEGYLKSFAVLKAPVDAFFDTIMVMTEDAAARRSRLALLADLRREMNRVADISKLAA